MTTRPLRPDAEAILNRLIHEGRLELGLIRHQAGVGLTARRLDRPMLPVFRVDFDIQGLDIAVVAPPMAELLVHNVSRSRPERPVR
jgi:hypothetical protein